MPGTALARAAAAAVLLANVVMTSAAADVPTTPGLDRALGPVTYRLPLSGRPQVLRAFDPPESRYGPGHLGVDLTAVQRTRVLAAGAGRVVFAGSVAGRGVVVVAHADGIRTEYEPVIPAVHSGQPVQAGQVVGALSGRHRGCAVSCLHWGARRGSTYLDPLSLLIRLGPVRLLPWSVRS